MTQNDFTNAIKPYVNDVDNDVVGNVIAHKEGEGIRIMLVAHYDVVCLMVTHIDEQGFISVRPVGSIDVNILPARKVMIMHEDKAIPGIIGKKPIHLVREVQNTRVSYEALWIDIGATNQAEAMSMVSKGDYVYFCTDKVELPNDLISNAYLDDQVGLEVLLELAKQLSDITLPWDVYFVASNYEEIGMRGASVVAQIIKPDICICIDVTHATDYPTMNVINDGDIKLGEGCVLAKGPNIYPELYAILEGIAKNNNIKYQVEVSPYPTGTDANMIQISGIGVRTALVSIPCRYMHTPYEICSKKDMESTIKIIYEYLQIPI